MSSRVFIHQMDTSFLIRTSFGAASLKLRVTFVETYPDAVPSVDLAPVAGITLDELEELKCTLAAQVIFVFKCSFPM